jgi:peptide/nickel transport system substrate-binding protein
MDDLVFNQRRGAYSDTAASRFNVPWISLVMERDARLVDRALNTLRRDSAVPAGYFDVGGRVLVDAAAARARYDAALGFFDDRRHLVVSNGPYSLWRYDPPAQFAELRAFREPNYPFRPGDWYFGQPPEMRISPPTQVELTGGRDAEIEVTVDGPGNLGLRYLLIDPATRSVVDTGEASGPVRGTFTVTLQGSVTRSLFPGLYELSLLAYSDAVARVEERTIDVDVR